MRNGRVLVLASLCACAGGVDMGEGGFGFGPPSVGSASADGDDEDADTDADADDDDGFGSTGAGEVESSSGLEPEPGTTSGALPPDTSGPPMVTTDPTDTADPGESSGFPDGTTGTPFPDTTGVPGGGGQLGDPCLQHADCTSNICVDAGFATYCSEQCVTEVDCPPGWLCVETTTPGLSVCF